jgi:hypothetical protein
VCGAGPGLQGKFCRNAAELAAAALSRTKFVSTELTGPTSYLAENAVIVSGEK